MGTLHRCRLCLKLSRNKIHIFKDDFPKMIEILTGLSVDSNDDFPKTSCLDCANNVKIALRTKKQIIRSHKILLEEFLRKCKENDKHNCATLNSDIKNRDEYNLLKKGDKNSLNLINNCTENKYFTEIAESNIITKIGVLATQSLRTITRSHSKFNKLPISTLKTSKNNPIIQENIQQFEGIEQSEKCLLENDNIQEEIDAKKEYFSDNSREPLSPMSDLVTDVDWTPNKQEGKQINAECIKPKKKNVKTVEKSSDGVFFVKKRKMPRKKKTAETVIRIKKKPKTRTPPTRVTCEICKKEVQSYWLHKHMETHEYNPVTCEFCGLVSKSATALRHHVFYYHKSSANEYMCDQCGRSFRSKYRLNLHKKKEHGGTKDFECTTCGKKFFERMHLKRHVDKTHKNIRPYVCDFCGKSFKSRNHIKIHERIHSKEAPYTCHMCGESFKMKLTLRTHLKGVHNVQEVQKVFCDICKRGFASDLALKAHINSRIHETEKCQYCSEMFTREYMVNHIRDVHGVGAAAVNQ